MVVFMENTKINSLLYQQWNKEKNDNISLDDVAPTIHKKKWVLINKKI